MYCIVLCRGVPQGSILGSLLFSLCTSSFPTFCGDKQIYYSFPKDDYQLAKDALNEDSKTFESIVHPNKKPDKVKNNFVPSRSYNYKNKKKSKRLETIWLFHICQTVNLKGRKREWKNWCNLQFSMVGGPFYLHVLLFNRFHKNDIL